MVAPRGPRITPPVGQEYYHDDSCGERLVIRDDTLTEATGLFCPRCQYSPDMQSVGLRPVGSARGLRCSCTIEPPRLRDNERAHQENCPRRCQQRVFAGGGGLLTMSDLQCLRPRDHQGACRAEFPPGEYAAQYQQVPVPIDVQEWQGTVPNSLGCNRSLSDGSRCALPSNHAGACSNPGQSDETPVQQAYWRTRCFYCKKPHRNPENSICECMKVGEPGYPWETITVGESCRLNAVEGVQARMKVIGQRKRSNSVPTYGKDLHDPEARVTVDAFIRQLKVADTQELERAFKEQERVMLSAHDWLVIIEAELNLRRRTGKY